MGQLHHGEVSLCLCIQQAERQPHFQARQSVPHFLHRLIRRRSGWSLVASSLRGCAPGFGVRKPVLLATEDGVCGACPMIGTAHQVFCCGYDVLRQPYVATHALILETSCTLADGHPAALTGLAQEWTG